MRDFRKFLGFLDAWWWLMQGNWNETIKWYLKYLHACENVSSSNLEHPKWTAGWNFFYIPGFQLCSQHDVPKHYTIEASGAFVRLGGLPTQLQASCVLVDVVSPLIPAHKVTGGKGGTAYNIGKGDGKGTNFVCWEGNLTTNVCQIKACVTF